VGGGSVKEEKPFYLNMQISSELIKKVDDFRFDHRFESRAEAIRYLLDWAVNNHKGKD